MTAIEPDGGGAGFSLPEWSDSSCARWSTDALLSELGRAPVGASTASILAVLESRRPELPSDGLLDAIVATDRLAGWVSAVQQRLLAAFARPGVAVPVPDLLDAIAHGASDLVLTPEQRERAAAGIEVAGDQEWTDLVAEQAARMAAPEIAAALTLSPMTARDRLDNAVELIDTLPAAVTAMHAGDLDPWRARLLVDGTRGLDAELRRTIADVLLPSARSMTTSRLRAAIARTAIALDPDAARDRAEQRHRERSVGVRALGDDLARFTADVRADHAISTYQLLDGLAGSLPSELRLGRTADQLRADTFTDLMTTLARTGRIDLHSGRDSLPGKHSQSGDASSSATQNCTGDHGDAVTANAVQANPLPANAVPANAVPANAVPANAVSINGSGIAIHLDVTVAWSTLARLDDQSALLAGQGVITADLARLLAKSARSARAVITRPHHPGRPASSSPSPENLPSAANPAGPAVPMPPPISRSSPPPCHDHCSGGATCNTELDYGRTQYRPPAALAELVRARDHTCRFPGCGMPTRRCDLDHRVPFDAGGPTCACNLDALCRYHHRTKTFTDWTAERRGGLLIWTSPLGRTYVDEPVALPAPLIGPAPSPRHGPTTRTTTPGATDAIDAARCVTDPDLCADHHPDHRPDDPPF